jgi:hypothetical protein
VAAVPGHRFRNFRQPERSQLSEGSVPGVRRIVYLGGIVPADGSGLSPHLRSRAEVGDILLGGGVAALRLL